MRRGKIQWKKKTNEDLINRLLVSSDALYNVIKEISFEKKKKKLDSEVLSLLEEPEISQGSKNEQGESYLESESGSEIDN